jgi:hypothetical protein
MDTSDSEHKREVDAAAVNVQLVDDAQQAASRQGSGDFTFHDTRTNILSTGGMPESLRMPTLFSCHSHMYVRQANTIDAINAVAMRWHLAVQIARLGTHCSVLATGK